MFKPAEPKRVADRQKLAAQARYIALNPCRKRLCDDPLSWRFSTHRDVVGAIVDPWVPGRLCLNDPRLRTPPRPSEIRKFSPTQ